MGLWNKIGNRVDYTPGKLTLKMLEDTIKTLYYNRPKPLPVIYTDSIGYTLIDFSCLMSGYFPGIRFWYYIPKRIKKRFIYVSLFQKHSLYKLKIHFDNHPGFKYELFYGTTSFGLADNIYCINNLINLKQHHERLQHLS